MIIIITIIIYEYFNITEIRVMFTKGNANNCESLNKNKLQKVLSRMHTYFPVSREIVRPKLTKISLQKLSNFIHL